MTSTQVLAVLILALVLLLASVWTTGGLLERARADAHPERASNREASGITPSRVPSVVLPVYTSASPDHSRTH